MKHFLRVVAHWGLLLHIYVSMTGFLLVLLFAVTGFTLNHQDFGLSEPKLESSTIEIPPALLDHPDQKAIESHLRNVLGIGFSASDYRADPDQIAVTFAAPGKRTVVNVRLRERSASVEKETRGLLGRLDDLHKGFDSGPVWYWTIDIAAIVLTISSLSGIVTLLSLRARRRSGFLIGGLAAAALAIVYFVFIPG